MDVNWRFQRPVSIFWNAYAEPVLSRVEYISEMGLNLEVAENG